MNEVKTQPRKGSKAKFELRENFTYRLLDKNGKAKPLFQLNKLGQYLMKRGAITPKSSTTLLQALGLGSWKMEMRLANLITTAGKGGVASRINGSGSEAAFTYLAIGIGTTAAAIGDTTLESEITTNGGQRAAATASRVTTDTTNDTARLVYTWTFTGSFAVTEAGALNAASAGVLLNRQVFTAVNVVSGDSLQVTVDVDVD